MPAVLGLRDGILDRTGLAAGRLVPLALVPADVPALHLDDRNADARPADNKVDLILGGTLDHRHRVQQRCVSGELVAQDLPDLPLGRAARAEPGLKRIATRHDRYSAAAAVPTRRRSSRNGGTDTRQPVLTQVA